MDSTLRIAVLLSGGGTTLENLCERIDAGELRARVVRVIASRADAFGLERAARRGLPATLVDSRDHRRDWQKHSAAVNRLLAGDAPDLICLAGYLCRYFPPVSYANRVMNIHPALLPAFGGQGMYGHRVHEAVRASGVKLTGCTVHFIDNEYDAGPIILQRSCPVLDADTPDDIARRVFGEECLAYPEAIRLFAAGRLRVEGRRVLTDSQ